MNGLVPIKDIQEGDAVKTQNGWNEVIETHKFNNTKKAVRIKLKNGKYIECTNDHKFFYRGRWVEIKNILSLLDENNTKL
jgi:intein/homing endonuclease